MVGITFSRLDSHSIRCCLILHDALEQGKAFEQFATYEQISAC